MQKILAFSLLFVAVPIFTMQPQLVNNETINPRFTKEQITQMKRVTLATVPLVQIVPDPLAGPLLFSQYVIYRKLEAMEVNFDKK